jgi:hypothetical protein
VDSSSGLLSNIWKVEAPKISRVRPPALRSQLQTRVQMSRYCSRPGKMNRPGECLIRLTRFEPSIPAGSAMDGCLHHPMSGTPGRRDC